jgi:hypothetical protein
MTRYGGMGRTRPKKLTSKASIPIVREHEIDIIDDEVHNALQQVETGVEKAEESVSVFPRLIFSHPCMYHVILSQPHLIVKILSADILGPKQRSLTLFSIGIPSSSCYKRDCPRKSKRSSHSHTRDRPQ